jgi:hypothetical protein
VARRLAASTEPAARWIGRDALRELTAKRRFEPAARARRPTRRGSA